MRKIIGGCNNYKHVRVETLLMEEADKRPWSERWDGRKPSIVDTQPISACVRVADNAKIHIHLVRSFRVSKSHPCSTQLPVNPLGSSGLWPLEAGTPILMFLSDMLLRGWKASTQLAFVDVVRRSEPTSPPGRLLVGRVAKARSHLPLLRSLPPGMLLRDASKRAVLDLDW